MSKKELSRDERIIKEIRNKWFKDHVAKVEKHGDVTVLRWKRPGSSIYSVKYILDGRNLYISGDLGYAIFELTWEATVESFEELNIEYFLSKMTTCSNGVYDFNSDQAIKELEKWKEEILEDYEFSNEVEKEEFLETMDELMEAALICDNEEQWGWEYINGKFNDFISEYDVDYFEWVYGIGRVIPYRNYAFLIGLQMAAKQLNK